MSGTLQYQTIKGNYQLNTKHAKITYTRDDANLTITRKKGTMTIKNQPARLKIDTFDARNSVTPTPFTSIQQMSEKAKEKAGETIQRLAKEGQLLLQATPDNPAFPQIDARRNERPTGEFVLAFLPSVRPNIEYIPPNFSLDYQKDKLFFNCSIKSGSFEFTPASSKLEILLKPELRITYKGTPNYVPSNYHPFSYPFDKHA